MATINDIKVGNTNYHIDTAYIDLADSGATTSSTSGTITNEQLTMLQNSKQNCIIFDNQIYRLQDNEHNSDILTYTYNGYDSNIVSKTITITISTLAWALTTIDFSNKQDIITSDTTLTLGSISAPTSSESSTYGTGTSGQVLKSNGNGGLYWANDINTNRNIYVNGSTVNALSNTTTAVNFKAGENVTITSSGADITIAATGGGSGDSSAITIVDSLPEATEENFEKGKIYTTGELLKYISREVSSPTVSQVNSLPIELAYTSAAAVGSDIYIFGGRDINYEYVKTIYKYSTTTNTITTMSATLPQALYRTSAAAVGTDVYIFGGRGSSNVNTIYKYSTTTNTITTLSTTLPVALNGTSAAAVGTDIYIFGGYSSASVNTIYKYSTTTNTITTLSTTLPVGLSNTSAAAVGTDIYVFGGYTGSSYVNTIYKYSTSTNTLTTMSATLPVVLSQTSAATVGTDVYIFGGSSSSGRVNTIYKYSTATNTITTMSATLPASLYSTSVSAVGTDMYIFGGEELDSVDTIYQFSLVSINYAFETLLSSGDIETSGGVTEEQFEELARATPTDVNLVQDQGIWQLQLEHDSNVLSVTGIEQFTDYIQEELIAPAISGALTEEY